MTQSPSSLTRVAHAIAVVAQKKATGELHLAHSDRRWQLHFVAGQLIYATSNQQRVRRWQRMLKQQAIAYAPAKLPTNLVLWEYHWLCAAIQQNHITVERGCAAIAATLWEVVFVATSYPGLTCQWKATPQPLTAERPPALQLTLLDIREQLKDIQKVQQRWKSLGLRPEWADLAPKLTGVDPAESAAMPSESSTFMSLSPLLNGKRTTWDVMVTMRQPPAIVGHILHHFVQQNMVEFQAVPDTPKTALPPFAIAPKSPQATVATPTAPLIACIDDSPQVCQLLEKILTDAGYRFVGIQDSVQAVPKLLEAKPDFIFLDLIMPIANGYEVCTQIRRVQAFRQVPVAILTGNDGVIDRVRAKVVGASDFLAKPINPHKILDLIAKYLNHSPVQQSSSGSGTPSPEAPQKLPVTKSFAPV
jgi:chemotaxis family two-component system response regulator PixG